MNALIQFARRHAPCVSQAGLRGLAVFFGSFSVLNVLGDWRSSGFDANLWWIDLRLVPEVLVQPFLLLAGTCLVAFGLRPARSAWRRVLTAGVAGCLAAFALENVVQFYVLFARGVIHPLFPVPLSFSLFIVFAGIALQACRSRREVSSGLLPTFAIAMCCAAIFPLAQMFCFGKTDYHRPADVAVVLGARVYADGRLSDALADRVRTGCRLYQDGLVKKLLFSGGPGDGAVHETQAMRQMAIGLGVRAEDILSDPAGLNTQATVRNTTALLGRLRVSRVLVVSHFYHLPRIKLAYHRAGWEVYTVPARESYLLRQMPYNMAREVAALWVYYFRPLAA